MKVDVFIITLQYRRSTYSVTPDMLTQLPDDIKVVEVEGKGVGVTACRKFEKYEFVCEYRGELITKCDAADCKRKYHDKLCFLFTLSTNPESRGKSDSNTCTVEFVVLYTSGRRLFDVFGK